MKRHISPFAYCALLAMMAACGGGESPVDRTPSPTSTSAAQAIAEPRGEPTSSSGVVTEATKRTQNATTSAPIAYTALTIRAYGTLADNVGPIMQLRVNGVSLGSVGVRSTTPISYTFWVPNLQAGSKVDVVFVNDAVINGQDRNLYVQYFQSGSVTQMPWGPHVHIDRGEGPQAFDGKDILPAGSSLPWNGALQVTWPASETSTISATQTAAARLLAQATFGPTAATINRVALLGTEAWINEQMALPYTADFVEHLNNKFLLGADYRPGGLRYDNTWVTQRFWATAANSPDQLRKRVAWALHHIFMVSQADSNLYAHTRAYARYLDTLNQHAFGNYRQLLEAVALSPAMGVFLSHLGNHKEDPIYNRQPDENFARELMQLFTIGLYELNLDGTLRLGADGKPIETYNNDDVMALAKVFTGYSWGLPSNQLTEANFRSSGPDYQAALDTRVDLNPMKNYAAQHSSAAKKLFASQPNGLHLPVNTAASVSLRFSLDTLFNHPNVGPFIGRQLIQRLVTSNPSPAYVARVAATFNNNGQGVRGDLAAVVRAVLLDSEARNQASSANFGRLREPVLRMTHWMRALDAKSNSGNYTMVWDLNGVGQQALFAPSVFSYYRPGYIPPQTAFASTGATAPEFQIVNESTTAAWVNMAQAMSGGGVGWNGRSADVSGSYEHLASLSAQGNASGIIRSLNLHLFAGAMSSSLQRALLNAMLDVVGSDSNSHLNRARVAVFLALASPEYLVQR